MIPPKENKRNVSKVLLRKEQTLKYNNKRPSRNEVSITINQFEDVIEKHVKPYLKMHDGDIKILSFKDGVLKVRLLGHCSNCPMSRLTIEDLISKELKERFNVISEVVLDNGISDETMALARKLLNINK